MSFDMTEVDIDGSINNVAKYLSTLGVDLVDGLESVQVINTGVDTNLVHNNNTGSLGTIV